VIPGGRRRLRAGSVADRVPPVRSLIPIERIGRPEGLERRLRFALWLPCGEAYRSPQRYGAGDEQCKGNEAAKTPLDHTAIDLPVPSRSQRQYPFCRNRMPMIIRKGCTCKADFCTQTCGPGE
jgi:hypothetical protein